MDLQEKENFSKVQDFFINSQIEYFIQIKIQFHTLQWMARYFQTKYVEIKC